MFILLAAAVMSAPAFAQVKLTADNIDEDVQIPQVRKIIDFLYAFCTICYSGQHFYAELS